LISLHVGGHQLWIGESYFLLTGLEEKKKESFSKKIKYNERRKGGERR
jgi:hypothetical protein